MSVLSKRWYDSYTYHRVTLDYDCGYRGYIDEEGFQQVTGEWESGQDAILVSQFEGESLIILPENGELVVRWVKSSRLLDGWVSGDNFITKWIESI